MRGRLTVLRGLAACIGALLCLQGCGHGTASADERLREIYRTEWQWRLQQAAAEEDDQKPITAHLPRVDPAAQQQRLQYWEQVLQRVQAIPRAQLSPTEQVNYDVYRPQLQALIANQKFRDYEMPANSDTAFWTNLGSTARRPFRTLQDYRNWLAQLREVPRYFHEQIEEMRAGLKRGFTPPQVTMRGRDGAISAVIDAAPQQNPLYAPFQEMPGIAATDQAQLRAQAVSVIRDVAQPAYAELLKFMREEYVPHCRATLAARDLPDGMAYYQAKIREFTTLELTPAQIHSVGEAEVARLHGQMLAVMHETHFDGDFPAFLRFLRSDPQFYVQTPAELLMRAAWIAKRFDGKAAQFFGYLPRARFTILPVPSDIAPFYTAGRGGPGQYLLNTYNLPTRPLYNLVALTLHESAPGHAFQIPIAAEQTTQPEFRRLGYISAYGEGWALYCELLGVEMGLYETPYERFGMLGYQIWRAARLVVDTGLHAQGWSREQALQYLRDYTALPDHEIETEVDRYIGWPGQALSYYLGEQTLLAARARAQHALGARFNIRAFHDTVLQLGSVPLPALQARVERFIAAGGRGPYPDLE